MKNFKSRLVWSLGLAAVMVGCGAQETALSIGGIILPTVMSSMGIITCTYGSGDNAIQDPVDFVLDTGYSYSIHMPLNVQNRLGVIINDLGTDKDSVPTTAPNEVSPLRFELRWECDATGFRSEVGPMVIPAFDAIRPFCLDRRSDSNSTDFVGFDVIPASGERLKAGSYGLVTIQPVTYELGQAIDGLFEIAKLADQCCRATDKCDGVTPNSASTSITSCQNLDGVQGGAPGIFDQLDPERTNLKRFAAGTTNEDLTRFRPFSTFNGDYALQFESGSPRLLGDTYPMRLRGILEGVTGEGSVVNSSEFSTTISFCKDCGAPAGTKRDTQKNNPCYYLF